jgi:hypothetical protein
VIYFINSRTKFGSTASLASRYNVPWFFSILLGFLWSNVITFIVLNQRHHPTITDRKSEDSDDTNSRMGSSETSNGKSAMTTVQKLRKMLADPEKFIACPGVYDGFTARIALQEGVDCLYMVSHHHLLNHYGVKLQGNRANGCLIDRRRYYYEQIRDGRHGYCDHE